MIHKPGGVYSLDGVEMVWVAVTPSGYWFHDGEGPYLWSSAGYYSFVYRYTEIVGHDKAWADTCYELIRDRLELELRESPQ